MQRRSKLIVGLGNPGKAYEKTRHNLGFIVLDQFGKKHDLVFRKKAKVQGMYAKGEVFGCSLFLLKPLTYMNCSGDSVLSLVREYKIDPLDLLVVVDDVSMEFGKIRLREKGSAGGHNGLKSVEEAIQTDAYFRLKIGVGDREEGDLTSHVLGRFNEEEEKLLPEIVERAEKTIEGWINQR